MLELIYDHLSTVLGLILGLLLIASILRQGLRPAVSIAWLLAIILVPYIGVPAYLLFGGRKLKRLAGKKMGLYDTPQDPPVTDSPRKRETEQILVTAGMPPARGKHKIELYADGQRAYGSLLSLIERATHSIHVETFILGRDRVGRAIVDALSRKAEEGVQVRLLLDALGCLHSRGRRQPTRCVSASAVILHRREYEAIPGPRRPR